MWSTDGSKSGNRVEAVFCTPSYQNSFCLRLKSYTTVFQAETLAIKSCAEKQIKQEKKGRIIRIRFDSQAAFKALDKLTSSSKLVVGTTAALAELGKNNHLNLTWILRHSNRKATRRQTH